jgi:hypothetical protein
MSKFKDQLFTDLMREHGAALALAELPKPRRNTRPVWVAAGAVAMAGAATAGITLFSAGTPAFAVTDNPDGSVTVSIKDPNALDAANRELARPTAHGAGAQMHPGLRRGGGSAWSQVRPGRDDHIPAHREDNRWKRSRQATVG